jgi:hypothetical protein
VVVSGPYRLPPMRPALLLLHQIPSLLLGLCQHRLKHLGHEALPRLR